MENRKIQINNTEQLDAMRVKLSNWVFRIAAIMDNQMSSSLRYLFVKYIPYAIIRYWYKSYTKNVGGINCLLNKKQAQPDPPLG